MAGRGMLFAEGPTACPFVALESDRDRRSDEPDARHRCYADPTPAPRTLAHQRQFCLSPDFGSCPIFRDWAVRAAARPVPLRPVPAGSATAGVERVPSLPPSDETPREPDAGERAAKAERTAEGEPTAEDQHAPEQPTRTGDDERPPRRWVEDWPPAAAGGALGGAAATGAAAAATPAESVAQRSPSTGPEPAASGRVGAPATGDEWAAQRADLIPSWERQRYAAYPSLGRRMRVGDSDALLGRLTKVLAVAAVVALIVALLIIFAPDFLGGGAPGPTPRVAGGSPTPTARLTPSPTPEPTAEPTPLTYRIQPGDTLFGIAVEHGVTVEQLLAANPQITNPNLIQVGQVIVIPPEDFAVETPEPQPATPAGSP